MQWHHTPPSWQTENNQITVRAGAKTDFWRKTHYGFIRDNGHFYYQPVTGNFTAEVKITGQYKTLYDQAGLMLRLDETNWLKCGIEYVEGVQQASVVVTREFSDWSVLPLPQNPPSIWLRLKRENETVEVFYSLDGSTYSMLRLAYLTTTETVQIGIMCAAPEGDGFSVVFEDFKVIAS